MGGPRAALETILLVEDAPVLLRMVSEILLDAGYAVLEASSAAEALRIAAAHNGPIQLLLSDLSMPEENGVTLAKKLVASRPETKVLFMSGYGDGVLDPETLGGRFAFIKKPFEVEELAEQVRTLLRS